MKTKVSMRRATSVGIVLALALLGALVMLPARAALATTGEPYTYKVRIWGGNHGTVQGEDCATVYESVPYDTPVPLDRAWVELDEADGGKYYVKGFRKAGTDNLDGVLDTSAPHITEDSDYVVVYGVSKELVSYTVSFVEYGTGRELTNDQGQSSKTYYGNKGDETVVAFDYISGYRPRYRNIKKTLGDEGTNDIVFEYIPLAEGETEYGGTTQTVVQTVYEDGGTTTTTTTTGGGGGTEAGTAGGGAAAEGDEAGGNGGTDGGAAGEGGATGEDEAAANEPPATEEILDMDNPLAGSNDTGDGSDELLSTTGDDGNDDAAGSNRGLLIGGLLGAVALGLLGFFWFRKKKCDKDEVEAEASGEGASDAGDAGENPEA